MSDISTLSLYLAILFFVIGVILFLRYFPWKRKEIPLYMTIVFDAMDYKTYDAIMQIISSHDLMDASYDEGEDTSRIQIGIPKDSYESIYKSLRTLQTVEVI